EDDRVWNLKSSVRALELLLQNAGRRYPELHADLLTPVVAQTWRPEEEGGGDRGAHPLQERPAPTMAQLLGLAPAALTVSPEAPLFVDPESLTGLLKEVLIPLNLQMAAERHEQRHRVRREAQRKERGFLGMLFGPGGPGAGEEPPP